MLYSFYISFTNYNMAHMDFIGIQNYIEMFTSDRRFVSACKVTLRYVMLAVPIRLVVSLGIAMLLKSGIRCLRLYRALYYIPSLLGGSVAISLLWSQVFGLNGIFNQALKLLADAYPQTESGEIPFAWIWVRTVTPLNRWLLLVLTQQTRIMNRTIRY